MVSHVLLKELTLLILGIHICCSNVVINLRIYNYQNNDDIGYNGKKCEKFHWLNDLCDPMFHVCVTSRYKCDIADDVVKHWKNKKFLVNVHSKTIRLHYLPRSLKVDVKIDDHDRFDAHDHIAKFSSKFNVVRLNFNYRTQMTVKPQGLNIHLQASIMVKCDLNYYGDDCNTYCVEKRNNYNCNGISGEKMCKLDCGRYGRCIWNTHDDEFSCKCFDGWTGIYCRSKNYKDCSKLSCKGRCVETKTVKYCTCSISSYVEKCEEKLMLTTTKTITTVKMVIPFLTYSNTSTKLRMTSGRKIESWHRTTNQSSSKIIITPQRTKTSGSTRTSDFQSTKEMSTKIITAEPTLCLSMENLCEHTSIQKACKETCGKLTTLRSSTLTSSTSKSSTPLPAEPTLCLSMENLCEHTSMQIVCKETCGKWTTQRSATLTSSTSKSSTILSDVSKYQRLESGLSTNPRSDLRQHQVASHQLNQYSPMTIIIIGLLMLLCICIIALSIIIRNKNGNNIKKRLKQTPHSQRPLPPLNHAGFRESHVWKGFPNHHMDGVQPFEYDLCTIEPYSHHAAPHCKTNMKHNSGDYDPYEEPMINNTDCFTCETDFMSSEENDSVEYEVPKEIFP